MGKKVRQSKTIWFNTLLLIATGAGEILGAFDRLLLAGYEPSSLVGYVIWLTIISSVANLILRLFTTEPINP